MGMGGGGTGRQTDEGGEGDVDSQVCEEKGGMIRLGLTVWDGRDVVVLWKRVHRHEGGRMRAATTSSR